MALTSFLQANPQIAYFAALQKADLMAPQRRYYESEYPSIYAEYLGQVGQESMAGRRPTADFPSFAQKYPFMQRFFAQPEALRGGSTSARLTPMTRFNY